ncbi:MAG: metallophosphoesterase [Desulfurococcales archaeon]|nr:metallophosphoesterase [Desulfurococcales archaeon]
MGTYLVISDTHDDLESIKKIKEVVTKLSISNIIHLGDYTSPFTLMEVLDISGVEFTGILGNNDGDRVKLKELGGSRISEQPLELKVGSYNAIAIHGFKDINLTRRIVHALARSGYYNIVLYGHTHEYDLRVSNNVLIMNPGTLAGYLSSYKSYGIIDLNLGVAEVRELETGSLLAKVTLPKYK